VDFLIMTDHITSDSIEHGLRGKKGRTLFIVGAEFSKGNGSVLGLDLRESVNAKLSTANVVAGIHQQRGLAFVGHAESFTDWDAAEFDGMEVYNTHANAMAENKAWLALKALLLLPGTLFRSMIALHRPNFERWDEITQRRRFVGIFGNDAHQNIHLFGPRAGYIGTYEQLFKITTTHVIAPCLDRESVMAALKAGRCYGALELWGDAAGFSFTATNGEKTLLMGDEAAYTPEWLLEIQLPVSGEIRILCDGRRILVTHRQKISFRVQQPGAHRVEAWLEGKPWIFSNAIRLIADKADRKEDNRNNKPR
jgi:hypothetical protein